MQQDPWTAAPQNSTEAAADKRSPSSKRGPFSRLGLAVIIMMGTLMLTAEQPSEAQSGGECVSRCNLQYLGSVKQCDQILSQNGRRDWHEDCVRNAGRFRLDCLRRCR